MADLAARKRVIRHAAQTIRGDRMTVIERWWRVTPQPNLNRKVTWTPEMPVLEASWEGASVAGPFVLESHLEGAVKALEHIAESAEHPSLTVRTTEYLGHVAREALAALPLPSPDLPKETP